MTTTEGLASDFWKENPEDGDHNQYWYSNFTIDRMIADQLVQYKAPGLAEGEPARKIAFLSTPSLYFSLPEDIRKDAYCFDFDKKWESDRGFVFYDFNKPDEVPADLINKMDMVVIDPPFIVHDVWRKYAETANLLLKPGADAENVPLGKAVCTTVIENEPLLTELLGAKATQFQPSIPNLVYQYNLFTNYPSEIYAQVNPEIP